MGHTEIEILHNMLIYHQEDSPYALAIVVAKSRNTYAYVNARNAQGSLDTVFEGEELVSGGHREP